MQENYAGHASWWPDFDVTVLSLASQFLMRYGALMWLACSLTCIFSLNAARTLRDVGI